MSRSSSSVGDQIEFLAPNDTAFGMAGIADFVGFDGDDQAMFGDDGPRSKWLPVVASVVVCGLLGGGIIAAAPWDEGAPAPPPTTTTDVTSTTIAAPTTTERVLDIASFGPPGYVLDDPTPFQLAGGWRSDDFDPTLNNTFEVWATPDATRTSGQWLAVATLTSRVDGNMIMADGVRIDVGSGTGVVSSSADGVTRLSLTANDQTPLELQSFGFGLGDLLAIADQIQTTTAAEGPLQFGTIPFDSATVGATGGVLAGLRQLVSAPVPTGGLEIYNVMTRPDSDVYYVDGNYSKSIDIGRRSATPVDTVVRKFLLQPVIDLGVGDQAELDDLSRHGTPYEIRAAPGEGEVFVATALGPRPVTLWSQGVDVSTLIGMLSKVRLAGDFEWADLIDRSMNGGITVDDADSFYEPPTVIGRFQPETDTNEPYGPLWTIQMQAGLTPLLTIYTDNSGWGGYMGDTPSAPTVRRFTSATTTFLIATVEWPNAARRIRVTVDGRVPVEVSMVQVGDQPVYAAGFGYTEMAEATVEFLDDDGNVVGSGVAI